MLLWINLQSIHISTWKYFYWIYKHDFFSISLSLYLFIFPSPFLSLLFRIILPSLANNSCFEAINIWWPTIVKLSVCLPPPPPPSFSPPLHLPAVPGVFLQLLIGHRPVCTRLLSCWKIGGGRGDIFMPDQSWALFKLLPN